MRRPMLLLLSFVAAGAATPAAAADFCTRLRVQTDAARTGFKTVRSEFRAGRTASGLLVTRTYSNIELWDDTACFFTVEAGEVTHSCETLFDKDDAAARARRDALVGDLKTCFGKEIKDPPVISDAAVHSAALTLTGARTLTVSVNAQEKDETDGRILISVRAKAPSKQP
jgi:hypothetical protein